MQTSGFNLSNHKKDDRIRHLPEQPIVQVGDLCIMGDHRLLCGDSSLKKNVDRLLDGEKIDMLLTDPPYGVSYVGKTKSSLTLKNDKLDEAGLAALMKDVFDLAESNSRLGAYWYATVPGGPLYLIFAGDWHKRGIFRQMLIWVKDSMVMGRSEYHYQHEPILFGWVPGGKRHKNYDRTRTTVWKFDRPSRSEYHPTMKPIALWRYAIEQGSIEGELVYDPFLGSGTSILAAERTKRRCYGMELDPRFCDVIVDRWERATGKKAELIS